MLRNVAAAGLAAWGLATAPTGSLADQIVYNCATSEPRGSAPDRLMSVQIRLTTNGSFVSVIYSLANGVMFDRADRYQSIGEPDDNPRSWRGTRRDNPDLAITGSLQQKDGGVAYHEEIHDTVQGQVVLQVNLTCDEGLVDRSRGAAQAKASPAGPGISQTSASPAGPGNVVPVVQDKGTFTVPVVVNGIKTLNFTVDSGASFVSIPADVYNTLMSAGTIDRSDLIGRGRYTVADGREGETFVIRLKSLRVGSTTLSDVTASVSPVGGPLLLGQSFLSRFRSWSLDNKKGVLILN